LAGLTNVAPDRPSAKHDGEARVSQVKMPSKCHQYFVARGLRFRETQPRGLYCSRNVETVMITNVKAGIGSIYGWGRWSSVNRRWARCWTSWVSTSRN